MMFACFLLVFCSFVFQAVKAGNVDVEKCLKYGGQEMLKEIVGSYFLQSYKSGKVPSVAFSATLTKQLSSIKTGQVIIFNNVVTNEGSGYNASTGIFTAPIDGMYSYSWSFLTYVEGQAHLFLYKNDKEIFRTYAGDSSNRHETGGATINLRLSRGDKVSLKSGKDGGNLHHLYCVFTGNLLNL